MINVNDAFSVHVSARLLDFFSRATPWHRTLWALGVPLTLAEILEASEAVRFDLLYDKALKALCASTIPLIAQDPGVGSRQQLSVLNKLLNGDVRFGGMDFHALQILATDVADNYLFRWSSVIGQAGQPKPERAARAIASYLLDLGFSSDFLHRWWSFRFRYESGVRSFSDLVAEAHHLAKEKPKEYTVLVAFLEFTKRQDNMPTGWISAEEVSKWLRERQFSVEGIRQRGGVLMKVTARDPIAATEAAQERLDRFEARVLVGSDRRFQTLSSAWVDGQAKAFPLKRRFRAVNVHALEREKQVYSDSEYSNVDAAIELLHSLASSSPATAAAAGWAAFEALLSEPGDHNVVADRMGAIVACSFPRAELTALSYEPQADAALAAQLGQSKTNRDRADALADQIIRGAVVTVSSDSDSAALERMKKLLADPYTVLHDIRVHTSTAFRRLYRQRNLVMHGGKINGVALRACLRTVTPLVGAGMDRIAHAWFVANTTPLELAARATINLATVGPSSSPKCVDLLGA